MHIYWDYEERMREICESLPVKKRYERPEDKRDDGSEKLGRRVEIEPIRIGCERRD